MNELLQKLVNANQICNQSYQHYSNANQMREKAQKEYAIAKTNKIWTAIILGCLLSVAVFSIIEWILEMPFVYRHLGNALSVIFQINTFGFSVILFIVSSVVINSRYRKKNIAVYEQKIAEADAEEGLGTKILIDNSEAMSVIPNDYWFPLATDYLVKIVSAGRAETINQALTMLDEQLHRWKIEQTNDQILAQQQSQTAALKGIRTSSAINATANVLRLLDRL